MQSNSMQEPRTIRAEEAIAFLAAPEEVVHRFDIDELDELEIRRAEHELQALSAEGAEQALVTITDALLTFEPSLRSRFEDVKSRIPVRGGASIETLELASILLQDNLHLIAVLVALVKLWGRHRIEIPGSFVYEGSSLLLGIVAMLRAWHQTSCTPDAEIAHKATVVRARGGASTPESGGPVDPESRALEELMHVAHVQEHAILIAKGAGFPEARLPVFTSAKVFWTQIAAESRNGVLERGLRPIFEEAAAWYPHNRAFADYRLDRASEPTDNHSSAREQAEEQP